ncbi:MAG: diguanylate cyclase domain-containing protein [Leptolyngbya sp. IPPAS B-1204]|nr:MAG: diguanylate cyclase [Leptolyngbya sp. IPPAS B-1204]
MQCLHHHYSNTTAIQLVIASLNIPHKNSAVSDYVTLSMGIASLIPIQEQSPEIIAQADQALHMAKQQDCNQVIATSIALSRI